MHIWSHIIIHIDTVPVICLLIGLVGEVEDVTDSELDLSGVVDAVDKFCEDRCSLDNLLDTLQPNKHTVLDK